MGALLLTKEEEEDSAALTVAQQRQLLIAILWQCMTVTTQRQASDSQRDIYYTAPVIIQSA